MRHFVFVALSVTVLSWSLPARAVIIAGTDGTRNTTASGTVSQFNNVGRRGANGSGIYLGDGVVLTANHVGAAAFEVGGTTYPFVIGSSQQLVDPITNDPTDLLLFRISGAPTLPALSSLTIADSTPGVGTSGIMAGNGRLRDASKTYWDVTAGVWTELGGPSGAEGSGYKWAGTGVVRWGTNVTANASLLGGSGPTINVDSGEGLVRSLLTSFTDDADPNSTEGQAAGGDSGGALFAPDGTLLGMMHSIAGFSGQPSSTAVFGNVTLYADLSYYKSQIVDYIPEPAATAFAGVAGLMLLRRRSRNA